MFIRRWVCGVRVGLAEVTSGILDVTLVSAAAVL